ncbi:MAG: GNAT family N-acetyltransferase [Anaerolineales bacterium]|nr:GNAT family N-acetyltransferase [Anaerolineales bacterium]
MIFGEKIRLRSVEREDLPRFVRWLNDPDVKSGLGLFLPLGMSEEEKWFEANVDKDPIERALAIDVKEGDEWVHVGSCGFFDFDQLAHNAELGILIGNKDYWDQGIGTDTVKALVRHGFETLNLHRITLQVFAFNQRAIKVYDNLGFVHEGRLREHFYRSGEYHDIVMMGLLRQEWSETSGEGETDG